jgi:hypothetical protein
MGRIGITLSRWGELGSNYLDGENWDYIGIKTNEYHDNN